MILDKTFKSWSCLKRLRHCLITSSNIVEVKRDFNERLYTDCPLYITETCWNCTISFENPTNSEVEKGLRAKYGFKVLSAVHMILPMVSGEGILSIFWQPHQA